MQTTMTAVNTQVQLDFDYHWCHARIKDSSAELAVS